MLLGKIDNESGHPKLVQLDEVMKASTGATCETQARAVHRILSGAVVKYPTKLNDISGAKAGFCVETVRRRIAEEIGLEETLSTCSEIVSVGVAASDDSVEMVTGTRSHSHVAGRG